MCEWFLAVDVTPCWIEISYLSVVVHRYMMAETWFFQQDATHGFHNTQVWYCCYYCFWIHPVFCGILVPRPGIKPVPSVDGLLTTGPQGIPWHYFLKYFLELNYKTHSPHIKMLLSLLFTHGHHLAGQFSSVTQSCPTLCNPMDYSMPGLPAHHQLQELTQTHVHWVGDATQPSHPLSSPFPPALNLSQHQGLFQSDWSVLAIVQHTTVLEFVWACCQAVQNNVPWRSLVGEDSICILGVTCIQGCWELDRVVWLGLVFVRLRFHGASLVAQLAKNLPAMWETSVRFLGC